MYKLIRRISSSFFPRPDRPWPEDATSNAPVIGRKRRLSSEEPVSQKRHRTDSVEGDAEGQASTSARREETPSQEVTEVTQGVRAVELEDSTGKKEDVVAEAAAVPLPDSPDLQAQTETAEVKDEAAAPQKELKEALPEQDAAAEKGEEQDSAESPKVNGVYVVEPKKAEQTAPVDAEVTVTEELTPVSASSSMAKKSVDVPSPLEETKDTEYNAVPAEASTKSDTQ